MKRGILFFLTQSAIVLALTITAQAAVIYTLGGANTAGGTSLGTIDTVTGAYSVISATLPNGYTYQSLTHNPTPGGTFYTTANTNSYLYDISVSGSTTSIGNTYHNNVFGLAYRTADNTLYAWDGQADNSATVNQTTGAWTDTNGTKLRRFWDGFRRRLSCGARDPFRAGVW